MKLIPYPVFLLLNALVGLAVVSSLLFSPNGTSIPFVLPGIGIGYIITVLLSENKPFLENLSFIPTRITALIIFLLSILLTFAPYLLEFTDITSLVYISVISSAASLLSLIFSNLTLSEIKD